jgi:UDP-2,3-diacylglucosamine pyrophosphatase LpxH
MLAIDDFLGKAGSKASLFKNLRLSSDKPMTSKLTVCIPDMHLLEKGKTDDFIDQDSKHEERFLDLLDFLIDLKGEEGDDLEIIQIGDMYDLWQAKGNANLIVEAYPSIIGLVDKLKSVYVVGNHDIDLVKWFENKGEAFGRKWRHYSLVDGKKRALFEHGFQADMANNQDRWSGAIGREITKIVGMMEYINPDIDVELGSMWDGIVRAFNKYNVFSPRSDPQGFNAHELMKYYMDLMEKYNGGHTYDHYGPEEVDLVISVIGHTHNARLVQVPRNGKLIYLMDCGSWVNGGHEFGVLSGKEMAVCQWN